MAYYCLRHEDIDIVAIIVIVGHWLLLAIDWRLLLLVIIGYCCLVITEGYYYAIGYCHWLLLLLLAGWLVAINIVY